MPSPKMENQQTILNQIRANVEERTQKLAENIGEEVNEMSMVLEARTNSIVTVFRWAYYAIKLREARLKRDSYIATQALAELNYSVSSSEVSTGKNDDNTGLNELEELDNYILDLVDELDDQRCYLYRALEEKILEKYDAVEFIQERTIGIVKDIFKTIERKLPDDIFDDLYEHLRDANDDYGYNWEDDAGVKEPQNLEEHTTVKDQEAIEQKTSTAGENNPEWISVDDSDLTFELM
ncbi:hypothetical protein F5Y16DRAFT_398259 [Xylariaceae sp. FL0255]|nr:hypothetical protein F5Y16DRAFT_398259 [Xylariaceae sp. FL0255]